MGNLCRDVSNDRKSQVQVPPYRERELVPVPINGRSVRNGVVRDREEKAVIQVDRYEQKIKRLEQINKRLEATVKSQVLEKMRMQQQLNRVKGSYIRTNNSAQQKAQAQAYQLERQRQRLRQKDEQNNRLLNQVKERERFLQQKQRSIESTVSSLCGQKISEIRKNQQTKSSGLMKLLKQEKQRELQRVLSQKQRQLEQIRSQSLNQNVRYQQNEKKLNLELTNARSKLSSADQAIANLQLQLKQQRQASRLRDEKLQEMRFNSLFQNDIFTNKQYYKKYLATCLEDRYNSRVVETRLLYRFDQNNKVNFHKYIDQTPNIIVVIRLSNGFYAAAYSQRPFAPRPAASGGDALLISITNQRVFQLVEQNRKGITYDEYYIIFGNSQMRLRSQESRVFSNFGISNGYFASRGETVNILLGEGNERQVDLSYFEAYQVIFESI